MALPTQLQTIEQDINAIKIAMKNLVTAMHKMVTLEQAQQLGLINQTDVAELQTLVEDLIDRVELLEQQIDT